MNTKFLYTCLLFGLTVVLAGCGTSGQVGSQSLMKPQAPKDDLSMPQKEGETAKQPASAQAPADFAFSLTYGACLTETLDTFQGTFTRSLGKEKAPVSIELRLKPEEMQALYGEMMRMQLFDYPDYFQSERPQGQMPKLITPAIHYQLQVRSEGKIKTLDWVDEVRPGGAQAEQLRDFFNRLLKQLRDNPEIQRLPVPDEACL